jgi:hypothetical protein
MIMGLIGCDFWWVGGGDDVEKNKFEYVGDAISNLFFILVVGCGLWVVGCVGIFI